MYPIPLKSSHKNCWDNNKRVPGTFVNEFNFVVIESSASSKQMDFKATSWGLAKDPYFSKTFTI